MNEALTNILIQVLILILCLLATSAAGAALAWAKKEYGIFKANQPDAAYELERIAVKAVQAAEQSKLAGLIADKKAYALTVAEQLLALKGIKIDLHLVAASIEGAVWTEINKDKEAKPKQIGFATPPCPASVPGEGYKHLFSDTTKPAAL